MPSLAGTKLDKYDMLEEVGHGGMAVVYRGHDSVLKREVAVKVLHAHLSDREESRLRLQREAIAVAQLRHENILEIFDYSGPEAVESYIVTEFIHGPTLREWLEESLDPRPAVAAMIVHRLALALCHAHRGGIVHRDIKPENVMIRKDDGCIKLMDFGIAQILDNQKLTLTGQLIGSPAYMAPELISGRPLDARTDLFSLGILLYQLSTGELPFAGRNPHEVLNRIADGNYPRPSTVCALVDRDFEEIIARALANNPDDRFQTVESLAAELENYLQEMKLEPSSSELGAYFNDPKAYIEELDVRVSAALMVQAEEAASDGSGGRAIRLLGRVLEIDPAHKSARALLARLQTRERRMRQFLVVTGTIAAGGMIAAAAMLMPPSEAGGDQMLAGMSNGAPKELARRDPPREPPPPTKETVTPASATVGQDPDPKAEQPDAKATDTKNGKSDKPKRTVPGRHKQANGVKCRVVFDGINATALKLANISIAGVKRKGGTNPIEFMITDTPKEVRLHRPWRGSRQVTRAMCQGGDVRIKATPPPALVVLAHRYTDFHAVCLKGCAPGDLNKNSAGRWTIPLESGEHSKRIKFKAAAPGYEEDFLEKTVYPGNTHTFPITLKKRQ